MVLPRLHVLLTTLMRQEWVEGFERFGGPHAISMVLIRISANFGTFDLVTNVLSVGHIKHPTART